MRSRQPLPRLWLMTDERAGDRLWPALARLPRGAGIVFRHHRTPPAERRRLFVGVRAIARRRGLVLVLAGEARRAAAWRADGVHGGAGRAARPLIRTAPAHGRRELVAAFRAGADAVFLSPVFATRSHPGAPVLGVARFGLAARGAKGPVIALGGMDGHRCRRLAAAGAGGWAAIDAWTEPTERSNGPPFQNLKVVPR